MPGREVVREHHRDRPGRSSSVPSAFCRQREAGAAASCVSAIAIMPGRMTRNGNSIFGNAAMSGVRRAADIEFGRHRALHDQEVGAPVAERQHEARGPSPCRTTRRPSGSSAALPMCAQECVQAPGAIAARRRHRREPRRQPAQPPTSLQPEEHQRREAEHDQEELQHLVVDRRGEPAEEDVERARSRAETQTLTWKSQPSSTLEQQSPARTSRCRTRTPSSPRTRSR